jgi:hypothetical protein
MNLDPDSEIAALKRQLFTLLVALIVVSGTLTVYLYRQASVTGKDLDAIRPQATQIIGAFNKDQKLIVEFVNSLVAYSQTHPDFQPVLRKYGIGAKPGTAPAAAPKP